MLRTLLLTASAMAVLPMTHAASSDPAVQAAEVAQTAWLKLVDAGQYGEAWKQEGPDAKTIVSEPNFIRAFEGVREPLGAVKDRQLISARETGTLPGAPDGLYLVTEYLTDFAAKRGATETIVARQQPDGSWKVDGYHIR